MSAATWATVFHMRTSHPDLQATRESHERKSLTRRTSRMPPNLFDVKDVVSPRARTPLLGPLGHFLVQHGEVVQRLGRFP